MILERIKQYIDLKGISVSAFEKSIGMSNASFGKSLKNGGAIGTDKLENILSVYSDLNPIWLLTGAGNILSSQDISTKNAQVNAQVNAQISTYDGEKKTEYVIPPILNLPEADAVPFYDLPVSAGALGALNGWESCEPSGYVKLDAFRGCEGVFPVMGVSMEPVVHSGDLIGIKSIQGISARWDFLQTGVIYLIITHEERMIKYIEEAGDNDYIVCSSPNYKPFRVHKADILQLYRVKAIVRGL